MADIEYLSPEHNNCIWALHIEAISRATRGYGVVDGNFVHPTAPASMDVNIDSGRIKINNNQISVNAGQVTIQTAHQTFSRIDLITRSTDGSLVVTAGVPSSVVDPLGNGIWRQYTNPLPPEAPDGHVILAAVFVQAGCSAITQDDIWMFAGGVTAHQDLPVVTTIRSAAEAEDDKIPSEKATRTQLDTLMPLSYLKTSIGVPGSDTKVVSERALRENFDAKINTSAIVTTIRPSGQAEDTKIPSEKAARDAINDLSNLSSLVHALNSKNPPVDADELFLVDSAASYGPKRLTWSNLKSAMKTYTDTLYAPSSKGVTNGDSHDHYGGDGAQIRHGDLLDLSTSDHHTQYLNLSRHDTTSRHTPGTVVPVVTSVGNPGSDTNIPTEKAVRTALSSLHSQNTDQYLDYGGANQVSAAQLKKVTKQMLNFVISGGGEVIPTGLAGGIQVPCTGTITAVRLMSVDGVSGSITVQVWKGTYDSPPTSGNSIGSWSISSSTKSQSTGLSISISSGDYLYFNVSSVSSLKLVSMALEVAL